MPEDFQGRIAKRHCILEGGKKTKNNPAATLKKKKKKAAYYLLTSEQRPEAIKKIFFQFLLTFYFVSLSVLLTSVEYSLFSSTSQGKMR